MAKKNEDLQLVSIQDKISDLISAYKRKQRHRERYHTDMFPSWSVYYKDIEMCLVLEWILEELEKEQES